MLAGCITKKTEVRMFLTLCMVTRVEAKEKNSLFSQVASEYILQSQLKARAYSYPCGPSYVAS